VACAVFFASTDAFAAASVSLVLLFCLGCFFLLLFVENLSVASARGS
jgi:hypothetical protein